MPDPLKTPDTTGGSPIFVERRRSPRQSVTLFVRYRRIDPHDLSACLQEYRHGICRNISDGGMLLEVEEHIPRGQVLEVYASDRGSDTTVFCIAETVRATRSPERYEVGVRFLTREDL